MWTLPLLLITFAATPCAQQEQPAFKQPACPICMREVLELGDTLNQVSVDVDGIASGASSNYVGLLEWLARERDLFRASIEELENATNHLVQELDIVRSRQAASSAVQASQVIMMVTYFLTILVTIFVKRCQKVSEKSKRKDFERLEMQLRSSKAKRRAAAAKEKSAPAQSLE